MLTIRLRRHGARRDPHYRVVVTERSAKRDGPFIEILGHYHPRKRPAEIVFDLERTESWLGKGAIMSDTVRTLYQKVKSGRVETVEEVAAPPVAEEAVGEQAEAAPETGEAAAQKPAQAAAEAPAEPAVAESEEGGDEAAAPESSEGEEEE